MDEFINDLKLANRRLLRQPLFTAIAIITLAIGIGANSAIFTLVNAVLLRPLPFSDPDELVWVHGLQRESDLSAMSIPYFLALQERNRSFTDVAAFSSTFATLTGMGDAQQIRGGLVTASYFPLIGIAPLVGTALPPDANEPGRTGVVVLSEGLWREQFGGDPGVVGSAITLDGRAHTIAGVMPESASLPAEWRFWLPIEFDTDAREATNVFSLWVTIAARMKPDVSVEQVNADVARIMDEAEIAGGVPNPSYTAATVPLTELVTGDVRMPLLVLLGAVGLVLLIACANMANLMLAQAAARATDFAVRRALGASSGRLLRQLLTESLALAAIGGLAGLLIGAWGADALMAMLPPDMPTITNAGMDWRVIVFTSAISLGAAALFGMAPAIQVRAPALSEMLREGGRGLVSRGSLRTRAMLVVAETALAFALVVGAGLLIRSLGELTDVDPGFRSTNTLSFHLALPPATYAEDERITAFWDQLMPRLEGLPGVVSVGAIQHLPMGGSNSMITFDVDGRTPNSPENATILEIRIATPAYFETLAIPLLRGRLLDERDRAGAPPVVLLSASAVAEYFPGEDPIGKRIVMGWTRGDDTVAGRVVGVVGDIRQSRLRDAGNPEIYFPLAQLPRQEMAITVHTTGDPRALEKTVRGVVKEQDPNLAVARVRTLDEVVSASVAGDRFITLLLGVFSGMALLLAAVGIFGVISFGVTQRRREFGVRMAIGATRREIVGLVLNGAVKLAVAGLLIGAAAAYALSRVIGTLLYNVAPTDPLTYLFGAAGLVSVAVAAAALPAWSASRLPPSTVLNTD